MTVVGRGARDRKAVFEEAIRTIRGLAPIICALGLLTLVAAILAIFVFTEASIASGGTVARGVVVLGAAIQLGLIWGLLWPRSAELRRSVKLFDKTPQRLGVTLSPEQGGVSLSAPMFWSQLLSAGPLFVFVAMLLLIFVAPEISGVSPQMTLPATMAAMLFLLITEIAFLILIFLRLMVLATEINRGGAS